MSVAERYENNNYFATPVFVMHPDDGFRAYDLEIDSDVRFWSDVSQEIKFSIGIQNMGVPLGKPAGNRQHFTWEIHASSTGTMDDGTTDITGMANFWMTPDEFDMMFDAGERVMLDGVQVLIFS